MNDLATLLLAVSALGAVCAVLAAAEYFGTWMLDKVEERRMQKHRRLMATRYLGVNGRPHN